VSDALAACFGGEVDREEDGEAAGARAGSTPPLLFSAIWTIWLVSKETRPPNRSSEIFWRDRLIVFTFSAHHFCSEVIRDSRARLSILRLTKCSALSWSG
jgi:hypothetical protein